MPPITSLTKWLVASAWLATNCFAFDMSSLCFGSYFVIPSALVATALHHGYMLRYIRRSPGQPIPRRYTNSFIPIIILWLAGGALHIAIEVLAVRLPYYEYDYIRLSYIVASFIAGILSLVEAGLVIVIWRKSVMLKANELAGAHVLGSLDNLDRGGHKPSSTHAI